MLNEDDHIDTVLSHFLRSRGSPQDAMTALDEIESKFRDRLDIIASLIGDRLDVSPSSWEDLRATVWASTDEDYTDCGSNVTVATIIQYAFECYGPVPEQGAKRRLE